MWRHSCRPKCCCCCYSGCGLKLQWLNEIKQNDWLKNDEFSWTTLHRCIQWTNMQTKCNTGKEIVNYLLTRAVSVIVQTLFTIHAGWHKSEKSHSNNIQVTENCLASPAAENVGVQLSDNENLHSSKRHENRRRVWARQTMYSRRRKTCPTMKHLRHA